MLILKTHFEQVSLVIVRKMIEEQFQREAAIEQDQEAKKKSLEEDQGRGNTQFLSREL